MLGSLGEALGRSSAGSGFTSVLSQVVPAPVADLMALRSGDLMSQLSALGRMVGMDTATGPSGVADALPGVGAFSSALGGAGVGSGADGPVIPTELTDALGPAVDLLGAAEPGPGSSSVGSLVGELSSGAAGSGALDLAGLAELAEMAGPLVEEIPMGQQLLEVASQMAEGPAAEAMELDGP